MQTLISIIPELSQGCKSAGKPAPPRQKRVVGAGMAESMLWDSLIAFAVQQHRSRGLHPILCALICV